jgi:hypothetical protein
MVFTLGGGHISWLANGNISNSGIVMTRGLWSGGNYSCRCYTGFHQQWRLHQYRPE